MTYAVLLIARPDREPLRVICFGGPDEALALGYYLQTSGSITSYAVETTPHSQEILHEARAHRQ